MPTVEKTEVEIEEVVAEEVVVEEVAFTLNGNIFKSAEIFTILPDFNYQFELKSFMGEEIPEPALKIFQNFFAGLCNAEANRTGVESEKIARKFRSEVNRQKFSSHLMPGDCTIVYTKSSSKSGEMRWTVDSVKLLDLLLAINYGETVEEGDLEAITW